MDDLRVIRELRPDVPLPHRDELTPVRHRLVVALHAPVEVLVPRSGRRRPSRRVALGGLSAAGIAAGIAAALIIGQSTGLTGPAPAADATEILHQAAQSVLHRPDIVPGPNQFVYRQVTLLGDRGDLVTYQRWDSVNGMRDNLVRTATGDTIEPGCESAPAAKKAVCTGRPGAYDPTLPTDATSMLTYLQQHDIVKYGQTSDAADKAETLVENHYLRPKVAAALFDAVAKIPGITVVRHALDAAGRSGIAVNWHDNTSGRNDMLVFDPETYTYLGHNTTTTVDRDNTSPTSKPGPFNSGTALIKVAIVNERGQQP